MTPIEKILTRRGPILSSELSSILSEEEGVKLNSASQRVSRAKNINQIRGFFKSNQSLCYLPAHTNDPALLEVLTKSMYENGRKYWFTLNALKMHEGVISNKYLECYTNYPIMPLKGHIPFPEVMQKFVSEKILVFNNHEYIFSPKLSSIITNPAVNRTIELIKDNILENFHSLARNIGLIGYNTGELFSEYAKLRWAFKGVSYVLGVKRNNTPGFLLADILLGKPFYKNDVLFFIEKIKLVQSFKNAPNLIPFLLVDDLENEALKLLKEHGVVVGFIRELFGAKYAEALKELITILTNAGASLKSNPDKYLDLIIELKKYNSGLVNNIKGTLFEFVVGHIHSENSQSVNLGRQIISSNSRHEMDVLATYSNKVVISECKALKGMVDDEMVKKWTNQKIPAFRKWLQSQETLKEKNVEFEYWSTSGFTENAVEIFNKLIDSNPPFKVTYFGPVELRTKAKELKNKKLKETLDNYFIDPKV